jgi:hypothetical protein
MEASEGRGGRITVGAVVNEAVAVYTENFAALFASALVVFVIVGLINGLLRNSGGVVLAVIAAIIQLAANVLYTGFVVRLVQDVRDGRRDQTVSDLFSAAAPAIVPLAVYSILFGISVAIGLILIIIPGLILLTYWSLGAPAIVVEGAGPIDAFGRSWRLVRSDAWSVFGVLVVVFVIVFLVAAVLSAIGAAIGEGATVVAAIIAGVVTAPLPALAISVMYFDLTGARPAAGGPAPVTTAPPPSQPTV